LYGTTPSGGTSGNGTVYELSLRAGGGGWTKTILYSFNGGADGADPESGVIFDGAGNLYGTTYSGGADSVGTVFKLTPSGGSWTETLLYSFQSNGTDGYNPFGGLIMDGSGNLYGTTTSGGAYGGYAYGTVFEITP
jgi:uncharacterized repeat protein (TIGR03803 family)